MATSLFIPEYVHRKEGEGEQKISTTAYAIFRMGISLTGRCVRFPFQMTVDSKVAVSYAFPARVSHESVEEFTDQIGIEI